MKPDLEPGDMRIGYWPCGCNQFYTFGDIDKIDDAYWNCTPEYHQSQQIEQQADYEIERAYRAAMDYPEDAVAWIIAHYHHGAAEMSDECDCQPQIAQWRSIYDGSAWHRFGDERRFEELPPVEYTEVLHIIDVGEPLA